MTIEHAHAHFLPKPWGVADLRPWSSASEGGDPVGEIWYERPTAAGGDPLLLLKLLFTSQPLSIQVHPDDSYAHSMGLPNGKTEAWYVLSATPDAKIGLGLTLRLSLEQLRHAINDGSIAELVAWQTVRAGDTIFVPAGTIHAIGAGVVIAEIQQRSDVTFRIFDHGRERELHIDHALAVADPGPSNSRAMPTRLNEARVLLTSNPYFTFEKIDLAPASAWWLEANEEMWVLGIAGSARVGSLELAAGEVLFAQSDRAVIGAGAAGFSGLVAYTGGSASALLTTADMETIQ